MADFDARVQVVVDAKKAYDAISKLEREVKKLNNDAKKIEIAVQEKGDAQRQLNDGKRALRNALALDGVTALYERRLTRIRRMRGTLNQQQQKTLDLAKQTRQIAGDDLGLMQAAATALGRIIEQRNELNRAEQKSLALQRKSGSFSNRLDTLSRRGGKDVQGLQKIRDKNKELLTLAKERKDEAAGLADEIEREIRAKETGLKNLRASQARAAKQREKEEKDFQKILKKTTEEAQKIYDKNLNEINSARIRRLNANTTFDRLKEEANEVRTAQFVDKTQTKRIWKDFFDASSAERERLQKQRLNDDKLFKQAQQRSSNRVAAAAQKIFDIDAAQQKSFEAPLDRLAEDIKMAQASMRAFGREIKVTQGEAKLLAKELKPQKIAAPQDIDKLLTAAQKRSSDRVKAEAKKVFDIDKAQEKSFNAPLDRLAEDIKMAQASMRAFGSEIKATQGKAKLLAKDIEKVPAAAKTKETAAEKAASSFLPQFDAKSAQLQRDYLKNVKKIGESNSKILQQSRESLNKQTQSVRLERIKNKLLESGAALRDGEIQQAKALNREADRLLAKERKRTKAARKRLTKQQLGDRKTLGNALVSGAFPALFGGGLGQSAGGLIGGAIGTKLGLGELFGIVGSAIGGAIEESIRFAQRLSDQLLVAASSMEALNEAGIAFSNTQEKLARQLRKEGRFEQAAQVTDDALREQIGVDQDTLKGLAAPVTLLDNAWKRLTATAGAALGTVFAPFVALLAAALEIVSAVFRAFNKVVGAVKVLLDKIPGFKFFIDKANEAVLKTSAEYQKQLNLLEQQIEALRRKAALEAKVQKTLTGSLALSPDSSQALQDLGEFKGGRAEAVRVVERARKKAVDDLRKEAKLEQEIAKIRTENPTQTEEQRLKVAEKVFALVEEQGAQSATKAQERANTLANQARVTAFNLEDEIQRKKERGIIALQRREEQAREQLEKKRLSLVRQQEDIFIRTARLIEDTTIKAAKFALNVAQQISGLRRRDAELAISTAEQIAKVRGVFMSAEDQQTNNFRANLQAAVDRYKADRIKIEEDARIKILQTRVEEFEAVLKIERFREDTAKRIARINQDSANYVAEVTKRFAEYSRQTAKAVKDGQLTRIRAVKAELELLKAQAEASAKRLTAESLSPGLTPDVSQELNRRATAYANEAKIYGAAVDAIVDPLIKKAEALAITFDEVKFPELPQLADNTGEATKRQTELENYIARVREEIAVRTQQLQLGEAQNNLLRTTTDLYTEQISAFTQLNQAALTRINNQLQLNQLVREGLTLEEASLELQRQQAIQAANEAIAGATQILADPDIPREVKEEFVKLNETLKESVNSFEDLRELENSFGYKLQKRITEVTSELNAMTDEAAIVTRVMSELSENVANGFADVATAGFDDLFSSMFGLEKQTKSVQEAFADLFKSIGQQFLKFATDLVQKSLEKFMLNAVADIFGTSLNGLVENAPLIGSNKLLITALTFNTAAVKANTVALSVPKFAGGGVARGGKPHIVGEIGPELFIPRETGAVVPNNKVMQALEEMAEPRMNGGAVMAGVPYKVGEAGAEVFVPDDPYDTARSSMVTSNQRVVTKTQERKEEKAIEAMEQSLNSDINVRYESTVINNQSYVTEEQFRQGLKQGAKQARAETMKQFRNRPAMRGKAGI